MNDDKFRHHILNAIRSVNDFRTGPDVALTIGRMLAALRLWPQTQAGVLGFLDDSRELTNADWSKILLELARRWEVNGALIENPFLDPTEKASVTPGTLEQLRRIILGAISLDKGAALIPAWLLQATLNMALSYGGPYLRGEAVDLQDLIVALSVGTAKARVFCAYDGATGVALRLAANGSDVTLDLINHDAAALCACLAAATGARLHVRMGDPLRLAQADFERDTHVADAYDVSFVAPPMGPRYKSVGELDTLGTGLPQPTSLEAVGVTLALLRGKAKAICLLSPSFLFKAAKIDQIFKDRAIRKYGLDTVVGLPRGILGNTSITPGLLIFKPENVLSPLRRSTDVFMVDARGEWDERNPEAGQLRELASRIEVRKVSDISTLVPVEALAANDFNLSVERYVLDPEVLRLRKMTGTANMVALEDIAELYRPQAMPPRKGPESVQEPHLAEVGVTDIDEAGVVRFASKQLAVTEDIAIQARKARLEVGDVLVVIKGSIGKVGFVRAIPDGMTWLASQSFAIVRLRPLGPLADARVLFRFLSSELGQANLQSLRVGSAVPGLQMADVRRLSIALPPPASQTGIAREVEALFELQDRIHQLRSELALQQSRLWPQQGAGDPPASPTEEDHATPRRSRKKVAS